jgi:uncharacterized tellurite resistance protein B-like protein
MVDPVKLEHFRNLVSISAADGRIEESEINSLARIASSLGIPFDRLQVMITHAHEYIHLIPQNNYERSKQLEDMIEIALVDGEFARAERELIHTVARKLGFTTEETQKVIDGRLRGGPNGP